MLCHNNLQTILLLYQDSHFVQTNIKTELNSEESDGPQIDPTFTSDILFTELEVAFSVVKRDDLVVNRRLHFIKEVCNSFLMIHKYCHPKTFMNLQKKAFME